MNHLGLHPATRWDAGEYAAGYRARFSDIAASESAAHCWRCGWEDADTEAFESIRHKRALDAGREDSFERSMGNLFDTGQNARTNGVPYDADRTEPWKRGWIAVDIGLGVLAERDQP